MQEKPAKLNAKTVNKKPEKPAGRLSKKIPVPPKKPTAKPMPGTLDECTKAHVSETYRLEDDDDACNDSVQ